jgi:hypothetical protein
VRIAPPAATGATEARGSAAVQPASASSMTAAYLAALGILALLMVALAVAWRRRAYATPARLAEQTGSAAVWWPPAPAELPPGPAEPAPVAAEVVDDASPAVALPGPEVDGIAAGEAPTAAPSLAGAGHRRRPRPAAVAAASLVSLGVALLRRRRR